MKIYKLVVYIPQDHVSEVLENIFQAGAGKIGNYDQCCFLLPGTGQFRPLEGSSPHLGQHNQLERVEEVRAEMICPQDKMAAVLAALKKAHPYEEPAFDILELIDPASFEF